MIKRETLLKTALDIVKLSQEYKGQPHKEMRLDGLVYGVLWAKFRVKRQHHVSSSKGKPKRIDFKQRGPNPVVIEFVTRTKGRAEIYGSQNRSELIKLCKQANSSARYLLLLDISNESPISKDNLRNTYERVKTSKGKYPRRKVLVIYVHPDEQYHFLWKPLL